MNTRIFNVFLGIGFLVCGLALVFNMVVEKSTSLPWIALPLSCFIFGVFHFQLRRHTPATSQKWYLIISSLTLILVAWVLLSLFNCRYGAPHRDYECFDALVPLIGTIIVWPINLASGVIALRRA